jgi:tRNA-specific 2-thiouridylase
MDKPKKVAVGLSGGVDSSVAAALLKEKGYDVVGITMEIFEGPAAVETTISHACYGPDEKEDIEIAASICKKLEIPYFVFDLKNEYRSRVISYFKNEYLSGRTPNPCVVCNKQLKFGFLLEKAKSAGIEFELFATGHYAQIEKSQDRILLKKAVDLTKDQTYFLYGLTPSQLSRSLFPLGRLTKPEVRKIAYNYKLESAKRPESQDFVAGGDYSGIFEKDELKEGEIIDENGNILGRHRGIIHYTVGQRRGLGVASPRPLYIQRIDAKKNRIVVTDKANLFSKGLIAKDLNLISIDKLTAPQKVKVKIRLKHNETPATVFPHGKDKIRVIFEEPQMSVAPGQSVVFYSGNTVVGGGIIQNSL